VVANTILIRVTQVHKETRLFA